MNLITNLKIHNTIRIKLIILELNTHQQMAYKSKLIIFTNEN